MVKNMQDKVGKKLHIKGGEVYVTTSSHVLYRVLKGTVLLYILPCSDSKLGRRLFLAEFSKGLLVPGLSCDMTDGSSWRFALVALDEADFEVIEAKEDALVSEKMHFAKEIGLSLSDVSEFESEIIELYNLNTVKEEGSIYKLQKKTEDTNVNSLEMIKNVFANSKGENYDDSAPTGNIIYDCAAFLCGKEKIEIASKERIVKSSGNRFALEDIARVSRFTIRKISLPDKWYKKQCGSFIAYMKETGTPLCLFPRFNGKYLAYNCKSGEFIKVDAHFAENLRNDAVMFYRPFPDEKITIYKLISFGLQKASLSDALRIVVFSMLGVLIGLLIPVFNEKLYDSYIPLGDYSALLQFGFVLLSCVLGNISFAIVKNLAVFRSMSTMEYAVQSAMIDRVFGLPESFIRRYEAAVLGIRVMSVSKIYTIISQTLIGSLLSAFFSLAYLSRMSYYSGILTSYAVIMLVVSAVISLSLGRCQIKYEKQKTEVDQQAGSLMYQLISAIEKVRISSSENSALIQYLEKLIRSRRINLSKERLTVISEVIEDASELMFSIIFFSVMINNELGLSIGAYMGFMTAFGALYRAVFAIVQSIFVVNEVYPLYELARPILETPTEHRGADKITEDLTGDIEINNVSFSYDGGESYALNGINLHVKSGEYIGIVGASGCGKSTLLKLLMGFEKPQMGRIYYDGQDIDELNKRELRKKFGVVLQDGGLIGGDIYDNITITAPNCSADRVQEVIRQVGLEKDIEEMPMGLQTVINEEGGTLSGGQIQRILIARAIAGKPKIIFLDEATSALDNVTQNQVIKTLECIEATKIMIAHRLSTIVNCDRIIVMDSGRIVEQGSYNELMEKKGLFYKLAIRQIA